MFGNKTDIEEKEFSPLRTSFYSPDSSVSSFNGVSHIREQRSCEVKSMATHARTPLPQQGGMVESFTPSGSDLLSSLAQKKRKKIGYGTRGKQNRSKSGAFPSTQLKSLRLSFQSRTHWRAKTPFLFFFCLRVSDFTA